jgi:hypothetical protein
MDRINKLYVIIGLAITSCLFFAIAANADEADQATTLTFSTPVEVPGQVLPAGSYLFKLADDGSDLNIVQVYNADGTKLYGSFQTIATDRLNPTDDTVVTLVGQGSAKPDALLKWFYPGSLTGNEFVYSGQTEKELAHQEQYTIMAGSHPTNPGTRAGE